MTVSGSYWGNFYIPIEYSRNNTLDFAVINHELAHAVLTESTNHGIAFYEFSSLSSENYSNKNILEILKLLQDASERTEECFAVLIPLLASCGDTKELIEQYNELRQTEYYHRYQIFQFDPIVFADATLKEKEHLITNILSASMNTGILTTACDWFHVEKVYQVFKENAVLLNPDKRLKVILKWVNNNLSDHTIFSLPETHFHKKVLGHNMPPDGQFDSFRNTIIVMADKYNLSHNYTQIDDSTDDNSETDRVYFHLDDSDYTAYLIDLPSLTLLDCDMVLFFPLGRKEHLVFTSQSHKEKYKLELPIGSLSDQLLNQFSGIIVAYLDDINTLAAKLSSFQNKKIIYKSVCNFAQLKHMLSKQGIQIKSAGIFQYDSTIGSPFFIDEKGIYYTGGPRSLEVLSQYTNHPLQIISPQTTILQTSITSAEFQIATSSDIAVNTNETRRIASFNGCLDNKIYSSDVGIDAREVCGYYFGIFEQSVTMHNWDEAQNLFNFILNLLDNTTDRVSALEYIDNILTKCKRSMINAIKEDSSLLKAFIDLYSMVLQGHRLLGLPVESTCVTLTNLANLYLECGNLSEANYYATMVLNLKIRVFGDEAPEVARAHYLLGLTLLNSDKKQARICFDTANKIATKINDLRLLFAIKHIMQRL